MQIIPAVDVLEGTVVRLLRGDYDRVTAYSDDPVVAARAWVEQGAELVHVVDLAGARSGTPDQELWGVLRRSGLPFQVGGGIRTMELASAALEAGASRVVLGSAAVWEPKLLAGLVGRHGPDRVVAALDVRGGMAQGAGWTDLGRRLEEVLGDTVAAGCAWVLATGIARDGTMEGPDLELVRLVRDLEPGVSVIGSGGVGSLADLPALREAGAAAVVVGRALYEGVFSFAEAIAAVD